MNAIELTPIFSALFAALRTAGYVWSPLTPQRLQALRKQVDLESSYDPLVRFFGIGAEVAIPELCDELRLAGLPDELIEPVIRLRPSISRLEDLFVPHMHWPAAPGSEGFVYLGEESFELARQLLRRPSSFDDQSVLDLGSGSGVLSLALAQGQGAQRARRALGFEISAPAVAWSQAAARAQRLDSAIFRQARIGSQEAEEALAHERNDWSLAVSNPPLAVPTPGDFRPHRDGGKLGIELPLLFLDFAARSLVVGGEAMLTATNPVVKGRSAFFDGLDPRIWEVREKSCLNDHFNASLHRKEGYQEQGIQKIELWFLRLKLKSRSRR